MASPLPEGPPSRHGVDAQGIAAFLEAVDQIELHSLMILRHGHVIASGWWAPYAPDRPHLLYSLSKSFTTTAAGLAVAEGLLDLDAPVLSYFPELDADVRHPRSRSMLVRHIASMSSGHLTDTWWAIAEKGSSEPVREFLRMRPKRDPGTVFTYNQSCTYTLATIIQRVTGQPLTGYLRPRLFEPIGIGAAAWDEFPPGQALGFSGLYATTDAIARLGELYLRGGQWNGRQVIPKEWVAEATRPHIATLSKQEPDWRQGYGLQFWMSRHGYRGDGAFGQFCLVLPEQDAVVAITAGTEDMQGILDAAWAHLLPAFGAPDTAGPETGSVDTRGADTGGANAGGTAADAALAKRLSRLVLRPPAGTRPKRPGGPSPTGVPAELTPAELTPAKDAREAVPSLRRVHVDDGKVTLFEDTLTLELRLSDGDRAAGDWADGDWADGDWADGDWHVTDGPVPVAASGGWTDAGTLELDVIFLQTPHRLSLSCSLTGGTFGARWHTRPLGAVGSLRKLRSPGT